MAGHLIDRVDTLRESHVELLSAYDVRLLNYLDEHPLESLIASLDTSNPVSYTHLTLPTKA